ncbi:MAG: hypothetical protein ACTSRS_13570 [Candidatus Helarchaeota archaeon]
MNNKDLFQRERVEERVYWIQIAFTLVWGIISFYLLDNGVLVEMRHTDVLVFCIIHFLIITIIPAFYFWKVSKASIKESFITPLKNIGTNILIYFIVIGFTFLLNI